MATHQSRIDAPIDTTYPSGQTIVRRGTWERIPWRGVFAGAFVAIAIQALLMLIGVGIGLVSVDDPSRMDGVALWTGIWWIIAGTTSVFIGAWVAGRLTIPKDYLDGAITGAVTWALLTVVSLWMATATAGAALGGAFAVTKTAAEAAFGGGQQTQVTMQRPQDQQSNTSNQNYVDFEGQQAGSVSPTLNWGAIGEQVDAFLASAGIQTSGIDMSQQFERFGEEPVQNTREFYGRVRNFLERGTQADRQAVVDYLANNTELTEAEINSTITEWQEQYRELRAEAAQMLDEATEATSDFVGEAALWTGFVLLLGLAAGCVGGAVGTPAGPAVTEHTTPTGTSTRV